MRFVKRSSRRQPKITLILLDWSVRESFHLLHYLSLQDVPRDDFEVLIVEYYSRESKAIRKFEDQVDTWVLLEMPEDCYYHKHLMYNVGIVLANGGLCVICDSDAMVKPGFVRTIFETFERDPDIVLHLDQFRNNRKDFYPFNFPSFEEVLGRGCINNVGGKTAGIVDTDDPIHSRNYGACMCAARSALIEIGAADEHIDFLGHICGPYDMTFRLSNAGRREVWHQTEFMYHTWHPGQAGVDNYLGPHDGRHVSTTSLDALATGRVMPLVENAAIQHLRESPGARTGELLELLIRPENREGWLRERVESGTLHSRFDGSEEHVGKYAGFEIYRELGVYYAHLPLDQHGGRAAADRYAVYLEAETLEGLCAEIDRATPRLVRARMLMARGMYYTWRGAVHAGRRAYRALRLVARTALRALGALLHFRTRIRAALSRVSRGERGGSEALADLVPNLYYLRRAAHDTKNSVDVTVLVERPRSEQYLRVLRVVGAIPAVRIERVGTLPDVEAALAAAERSGREARVVMSRGLYWRCYPLVAGHALRDRLIVL